MLLSEEIPFTFNSETISLDDVKLNLNFNEVPSEAPCYVFSAPLNELALTDSNHTDTSEETIEQKYEMPLSASEESLVNFANSLAADEDSKFNCTPIGLHAIEDPLKTRTETLLANDAPPFRDYVLASTPVSPETMDRPQKVTFDSNPSLIHTQTVNVSS